jgi:hypothetical protein
VFTVAAADELASSSTNSNMNSVMARVWRRCTAGRSSTARIWAPNPAGRTTRPSRRIRDPGRVLHAAHCGGQTRWSAQPLRGTPNAFGPRERQRAALLAGQATIAVTAALRHYDEVTLSDQLRIALSSRSVIDQALGIVMAQQRGTPEQAFAALRTISQRRNIKLRVVAAELVKTISRGEPGTEPKPAC